MIKSKPLRQIAIDNPSVDYIKHKKEKEFAAKHTGLKTHSASYHAPQAKDDEEGENKVFKATNVKVADYKGRKEVPKDSYGDGNPFDDISSNKNRVVPEEKSLWEVFKSKVTLAQKASIYGDKSAEHEHIANTYLKDGKPGVARQNIHKAILNKRAQKAALTQLAPHVKKKEKVSEEKQIKEAIEKPNTSGQGHDPNHESNPYHYTIIGHGFKYSHTTPVKLVRGAKTNPERSGLSTVYHTSHHHTYSHGEHKVGVWPDSRGFWHWDSKTSSASGHEKNGHSKDDLDKHLKGKVKRYKLNELSKKTLGSYVKKSSKNLHLRGVERGAHGGPGYWDKLKKTKKREKFVDKAVDKLTKEETLDEAKAKPQVSQSIRDFTAKYGSGKDHDKKKKAEAKGFASGKREIKRLKQRGEETNLDEMNIKVSSSDTKATKRTKKFNRWMDGTMFGKKTSFLGANKKKETKIEEFKLGNYVLNEKSKSGAQARLMAACAHGADYDSCPPKKVAKEFNQKDKGTGIIKKEELKEGRRAMPLRGHPYHEKPDSHLHHIMKDAGEAAKNFRNSGFTTPESGGKQSTEGKYLDQVNDAATVLHYRKQGGKRVVKAVKENVKV